AARSLARWSGAAAATASATNAIYSIDANAASEQRHDTRAEARTRSEAAVLRQAAQSLCVLAANSRAAGRNRIQARACAHAGCSDARIVTFPRPTLSSHSAPP